MSNAMSNYPIQVQWSANQTASSVVSIALGTLAALGRDNVQPIAYVACEMLGATLAISNDVTTKMQAVVIPPTPPAPIAFLKAQVGFFGDDSATVLGQSQAGVRSLALVAALTSTLPLFDAARAIEIMLQPLTPDPTVLPSTRNIKTLLETLEPRCHRAGFANEVLGWRLLLQRIAVPLLERRSGDGILEPDILLGGCPSAEMVDRLVDAFRQVGRVGPSTVTEVTINVRTAVPWVIAFTKWSLGAPPRICFDYQSGEDIFPPTGSLITLLIPRYADEIERNKGMSVAIHHAIGSPNELLAPSGISHCTGMVPIKTYGELLVQELGFEPDFENRMLHEALHCAVPQSLELLNLSRFVPNNLQEDEPYDLKTIDESLKSRRFSPLPNPRRIATAYMTLFDLPRQPKFGTPNPSTRVRDCPLVRSYFERLELQCPCADCSATRGSSGDEFAECDKEVFNQRLSQIIVIMFSLSLFDTLFDNPKSLLLSIPLALDGAVDDIQGAIMRALKRGEPQSGYVEDLLMHARGLIGHERPKSEPDPPVMTSGRGQVLFPTLLERRRITKNNYMALTSIPGILKHENDVYREAENGASLAGTIVSLAFPDDIPPVFAPLNLFHEAEACWEVTKKDDGHLGCALRIRSRADGSTHRKLRPMDGLFGLTTGLFLETCPHSSQASLERTDEFASYCGPFDDMHDMPVSSQSGSHVAVVAVDGAEDLRLASVAEAQLGDHAFYVLRGDACLECCLKLCRVAGVVRLIL